MLDNRTDDGHDQPWLPPSARRPYEHEESQEPDIFRRWNMNRRKHFFAIGMTVLMLGFIGIGSVNAAEPKSTQANWESLKQLVTGQEVRVVLNDAKSYSGQFQSVSDDGIMLRLGKDSRTFERQNVLRVSTRGKGHRGRNALIGLAVGAGAGVIVGVASPELGQGKCAQGSCINAESAALAGFVGAAVGTGLGAVLPTGGWHDVYRAR
jgi:hypothetical protein